MPISTRDSCRRILVTGSSGTLGYNIIAKLIHNNGYDIIAPVRSLDSRVVHEFGKRVQFVEHELSDAIHTAQIFERANPDVIVHCAASGLRPPRASWFDLMHFNVESTMRLFQMNCRFDHHSRFIYISTGLVYREQGRPLTEEDPIETLHPYGASKAASDAMLQAAAAEFKRPLTIIRPFAFTGLHDGGRRVFLIFLARDVAEGGQQFATGPMAALCATYALLFSPLTFLRVFEGQAKLLLLVLLLVLAARYPMRSRYLQPDTL